MIAEIGHFALVLALGIALVQAIVPLWGASTARPAMVAVAAPASLIQFALVALSFGCLAYGYVVSDFSLVTVFENSHSDKPLLYKITGVWGNHEGSMLLWVLILTLYGAAVGLFGGKLPRDFRARVLSVHGMIGVGFLAFILFTSNPFLRLAPVPPDGQGMNPVLQDPGLAFHPPMLYLGYVGFSMAFSFAVAALIEGRVDAAWARWVRPWTLAAWCALTAGICLGSWWAYYELGWGGWWSWDPVENASFMPWLSGTALLHSAIVVEKRDSLKTWTIFLALLTFALSLLGTFLVRSGVLTSVHAFASDPRRGAFILVLLALVVGGSLVLYALRAPALRATGSFALLSREGALVLNNLLLACAATTVFLGTLYPLFLSTIGGPSVSVGAPYYEATFLPLMVPLLLALGIGPLMTWKRADIIPLMVRLRLAFVLAVVAAAATAYLAIGKSALAPLGLGLAAWIFIATLTELAERIRLFRVPLGNSLRRLATSPRAAFGMSLAHAGLAVTIAGITVSTGWQAESIQVMKPGDSVTIAGDTWHFDGTSAIKGENWQGLEARFTLSHDGKPFAVLTPARHSFPLQQMTLAKVAIHTDGFADWYAVLGEEQPGGGWVARLYHNPLVPWVWFGALIMALGGIVSLTDRRLRIGAPLRRAKPAPEMPEPHVPA
ncbi:MAG TPA: heme lyase CcmF/NrfE family subunit [Stellaceae bacterium]|nr:heme lyase CcmF/NrfE family subunit [Stellaceae bacterium]